MFTTMVSIEKQAESDSDFMDALVRAILAKAERERTK